MKNIRNISERDIAIALILEFVDPVVNLHKFSLMGYYDQDLYFLDRLAGRLDVNEDKSFRNKLTKVVRNLVNHGVLYGEMVCTHKAAFGEPTKQMEYALPAGKVNLIRRGETEYTMSPEDEIDYLLRRAYPDPTNDE
jgi:hypothetical protein